MRTDTLVLGDWGKSFYTFNNVVSLAKGVKLGYTLTFTSYKAKMKMNLLNILRR